MKPSPANENCFLSLILRKNSHETGYKAIARCFSSEFWPTHCAGHINSSRIATTKSLLFDTADTCEARQAVALWTLDPCTPHISVLKWKPMSPPNVNRHLVTVVL